MTPQEIREYNIICAEFLGWEIHPNNSSMMQVKGVEQGYRKLSDFMFIEGMKFHTDWNWIMQVVEKIEKLGFDLTIGYHHCYLYKESINDSISGIGETKMEACIQAIYKFLTWYNNDR